MDVQFRFVIKVVTVLLQISLILTIFFGAVGTPVQAGSVTSVQVDAPSSTIAGGKTFTINVTCTPAKPIKAFELKILYDPTLLTANTVTEGTIFRHYQTFFNAGVINNTQGTIKNVYDLILGQQTVTASGTLVKVSFTAKTTSGSASITLMNVGVTNTTSYVPVSIANGSVRIMGSNEPPIFYAESPTNSSTNIPLTTSALSLTIQDPNNNLMNYTVQTRPNIGSISVKNAGNGVKSCAITNLQSGTTYRWWVNATDGKSWTRRWYTFTTVSSLTSNQLTLSQIAPSNNSVDVPLDITTLSVLMQTAKGTTFSWTIQTSPLIGSNSGSTAMNGTKTCSLSGLSYGTTYRWWVNATDGSTSVRRWYVFSTIKAPSQPLCTFRNETPSNTTVDAQVTTTTLSVAVQNTKGHQFSWTITTNPDIGTGTGTSTFNRTTAFCTITGLYYQTVYQWIISCQDLTTRQWTNTTYTFATRAQTENRYIDNSEFSEPSASTPPTSIVNETTTLPTATNDTSGANTDATNVPQQTFTSTLPAEVVIDSSIDITTDQTIRLVPLPKNPSLPHPMYFWEFGDGDVSHNTTGVHTYATPGQYVISLIALNNKGQLFSQTIMVTVNTPLGGTPKEPSTINAMTIILTLMVILLFLCSMLIDLHYRKKIRLSTSHQRPPPGPQQVSKTHPATSIPSGIIDTSMTVTDDLLAHAHAYLDDLQKLREQIDALELHRLHEKIETALTLEDITRSFPSKEPDDPEENENAFAP